MLVEYSIHDNNTGKMSLPLSVSLQSFERFQRVDLPRYGPNEDPTNQVLKRENWIDRKTLVLQTYPLLRVRYRPTSYSTVTP